MNIPPGTFYQIGDVPMGASGLAVPNRGYNTGGVEPLEENEPPGALREFAARLAGA